MNTLCTYMCIHYVCVYTYMYIFLSVYICTTRNVDASGQVRHWHVSTKQCLSTILEDRHTLAARFAPDYLTFATAGSDGKVHIYDHSTKTLQAVLEPRLGIGMCMTMYIHICTFSWDCHEGYLRYFYMYICIQFSLCRHTYLYDRCMGVQRHRHRLHIPCSTVKT